jgi:hypothetical protein
MSSDLGPVGSVDGAAWRSYLGLEDDEDPTAVIVEGTWWREERTRARLEGLDTPRELGVPDLFIGGWGAGHVLYACPYGAPRTAEIVPTAAVGLDGVASHYAGDTMVAADALQSAHGARGCIQVVPLANRTWCGVCPVPGQAQQDATCLRENDRGTRPLSATLFEPGSDHVRLTARPEDATGLR